MLTILSVRSCGIQLRTILQEMLEIYIFDTSLKITNLRLQAQLPGVNEIKTTFAPYLFIPHIGLTLANIMVAKCPR